MTDIPLLIVGLLVSMVLSAFFSGMEIAFVSSNRLRAEMDREKNGLSQRAMSVFYRHPSDFVSTMLVGNNIALVVYGILFARIFDATLFHTFNDGWRLMADTLLSTIIVLFTGEFLPKTIFRSNPNTLLTFFAIPAYVCYVVLYPVTRFSMMLSRVLLRIFGIRMEQNSGDKAFTKVDLDYLVQSSIENARDEDDIEDDVKIFQNALEFPDTKVRDCMVPRTEIDAVEDTASLTELKQTFIESGHSKVIVYHEDIDHVVGYIHSSEMFRNPTDWSHQLRTLPFVPETMAVSKLMKTFMQEHKSIAVVVDEFGGTSGLITLEDIVEEIFGDIEDEHDNNHYVSKQLDNGEYLLSARLEIAKVNEVYDLHLPESDEYMTVGGLILHEYQSFPKLNEVVHIGSYEFKILKKTMTKIELVKLKVGE